MSRVALATVAVFGFSVLAGLTISWWAAAGDATNEAIDDSPERVVAPVLPSARAGDATNGTISDPPAPTATPAVLVTPVRGAGTISFRQASADLEMAFSLSPGAAGLNNLNFYIRDVDGDDRPYTRLITHITYLDAALPSRAEQPVQLHEGHWPLDGYELAPSGRWRVDAIVSRDGFPDTNFSFELRLASQ